MHSRPVRNKELLTSADNLFYMKKNEARLLEGEGLPFKAGEHVEQALQRFSQVVEQCPVTVVITDTKGDIEYVNTRFTELTGYTREEAIGINPRIMKSGKTTPDEYRVLWETILSGNTWHGEFYNKKKNGDFFWEKAAISPICNEEGNITHFVALKEDITARKQAEQAMMDAEEKFRLLSMSAQDGIIMMNEKGLVTYWSHAAEKIFGYGGQEMIGKHLHQHLTPPDYLDLYERNFPAWQTTGKGPVIGRIIELPAVRKDGQQIAVELSLSSAWLNQQWHAIGIIHDVTERKAAEEQLRQAKDAADAASSMKSEFMANMSHELRTPMNGIIGMASLLMDTALTREQQEYVEMIRHSSDMLLAVISDVLDFSKIEAGRLDMEEADFDLRKVIAGIAKTLRQEARVKGLDLTCSIDDTLPPDLRGDAVRLRQVLLNLGGNAVKFTKEGEISLRVVLDEERGHRVRVRFSVADTGIGIPADKADRLFQSFSQVDASMTRRYGGTGLGLAISKHLVELMDGQIGFDSEEGKGSRFWFVVPFAKSSREKNEPAGSLGLCRSTSSQEEREEIFDHAGLLRRLCGDHALVLEITGIYLQEAPEQIGLLERALAAGEMETAIFISHRLKGSSANIGAHALQKIFAFLEAAAREGHVARAEELIEQSKQQFERFAGVLNDKKTGSSNN